MKQADIEIATADGTSRGVIFRHDEPRPGILHLTDIGGIRPAHLDLARRLAEEGFCVLVPNVFYRSGEPPIFDAATQKDDGLRKQRFAELIASVSAATMRRDAKAYVDALVADPGTRGEAIGVVGHCITGKMAIYAAAERPDVVRAAVSIHGGHLVDDTVDSPHLALPAVKARLFFAHAIDDESMPAAAIATLDEALAAWGGRHDSELYPARHGFTASNGAMYDPVQAERVFGRLSAVMAESLASVSQASRDGKDR